MIDAQVSGRTFIVQDNPVPGWALLRDVPPIHLARVANLRFLAVVIFSEQPDVSDFSDENVLRMIYNFFPILRELSIILVCTVKYTNP